MAADGHTKRRILVRSMRYGLRTQPALLVRGSSRRIMTLRFRPAYIRVINRRYLSTAATCSAFQNKTGWIFLCRGRSSPEEQPIQNPSNQGFYSWLDKSLHISTGAATFVANESGGPNGGLVVALAPVVSSASSVPEPGYAGLLGLLSIVFALTRRNHRI